MEGAFLLDFLFNQMADTLILYLIKKKRYPEKDSVRVVWGGCGASISYSFWNQFLKGCGIWIRGPAAVLLVSAVLVSVFGIHSCLQFLLAWGSLCHYTFMTGGCAIAINRISRCLPAVLKSPISGYPCQTGITCLVLAVFGIAARLCPDRRGSCEKTTDLYQVEIYRGKACVKCTGLYDSGNLLSSQITGQGICVLTRRRGEKLLTQNERTCLSRNLNQWLPGLYPIHYHCISEKEGIMAGVLADQIVVRRGDKVCVCKKGMVGISKAPVSSSGRFEALLPQDIFTAG